MTKKYEVKPEQAKLLKALKKIVDKTIPQVKEIKPDTFGVKIEGGNVVGLGLNNRGLSTRRIRSILSRVKSISNLKSLEKLYLWNNNLTTLPESIGDLRSLKELWLTNNPLTTLPESIGNLTSLTYLSLDECYPFSTLPESIGDLKSLQTLILYGNNFTTFPESIGDLKSLQTLALGENNFTTFPESIGDLKSLEKLDLCSNQLTTFPESITKLKSLQGLGLGRNKLSSIPESIGNLSSLKELYLENNELTTLPESITRLTSLFKLNLNDNKLKALPESIGNLSSLKDLYLENNELRTLPRSIWSLINLKTLTMAGNPLDEESNKIANRDIQSNQKIFVKENKLKKRFSTINNLIQEGQISDAIRELKNIIREAKDYNLKEILKQANEMLNLCEMKFSSSRLEKRFPKIENLIQEKKISEAIIELDGIRNIARQYNLNEILKWTEKNLDLCDKLRESFKEKLKIEKINTIKKTVLDLGIKFTRLQIIEIAEECGVEDDLIVSTVKEMIENKEIYAKYFSSSNSIAFDQQVNIDEIDNLMRKFEEWEKESKGKKY